MVNARLGSYLLKTIDTSGNLSIDFAMVKTTIPELEGLNFIETLIEDPAFNGTKMQLELLAGGLQLSRTSQQEFFEFGTYDFNTIVDVGDIHSCRLISNMAVSFVESVPISTWVHMSDIDPLAEHRQGETEAVVQVATADKNLTISDWPTMAVIDPIADVNGSNWSGWQNLTAGYYTGKYFKFRAVLTTVNTLASSRILALSVIVDMPDRIDSVTDITCPDTGQHIDFAAPFKVKPVVAITGENMNQGDYFKVSNITMGGFDIAFYDKTPVGISRVFDYMAKGYGKVLPTVNNAIESGKDDALDLLPNAMSHTMRADLLI